MRRSNGLMLATRGAKNAPRYIPYACLHFPRSLCRSRAHTLSVEISVDLDIQFPAHPINWVLVSILLLLWWWICSSICSSRPLHNWWICSRRPLHNWVIVSIKLFPEAVHISCASSISRIALFFTACGIISSFLLCFLLCFCLCLFSACSSRSLGIGISLPNFHLRFFPRLLHKVRHIGIIGAPIAPCASRHAIIACLQDLPFLGLLRLCPNGLHNFASAIDAENSSTRCCHLVLKKYL